MSHESSAVDIDSYTPFAIQRNWRTRNAFPICPDEITSRPLKDYFEQLQRGSIFAHTKFGEALVEKSAINVNGLYISVLTRIIDGVKDWGLSKITFENKKFVHEACGTFFTLQGAEKDFHKLIGENWDREKSIDDYC